MQLKLTTTVVDGILVVHCAGRIVFGEESGYLRDNVKKYISEHKKIVLDLAQVTYIDSGGLGTLVGLYTSARNNGSAIKLSSLTERVGELLQVTKLVTVFEVYDSPRDAVEAYKKGAAA